ncbi:MAG: conjugal transfer protein TrbL family protein [Merdibacter sp.]
MFDFLGEQISNVIWDTMLKWFYETIYGAVADFFTMMGNMGADIFDLDWVQATIKLFTLFGWTLFIAGVAVAVFDTAIEYQNGRATIKTTALNVLKGFFACSLIGIVPVELYKFCISLQNTFSHDLSAIFAGHQSIDLAGESTSVLVGSFAVSNNISMNLFNILALIAFAYCVIKIFFQNIKRGGILLVQMAVGALYMFSVPRGYTDGFNQWMKQVAAICLTAFMQTTLLFLGLLTFPGNMLLGLGIMLAANEVPRIAQQFGLDSSVRVNMMSVVHATTTAVNLTRSVARAAK